MVCFCNGQRLNLPVPKETRTGTAAAKDVFSATPNVSFTYDTPYNRVLSMTDGTGTTNYAYNTITGSATTGAGRLHTVTVPISSTTAIIAYTYDELGRVTNRTIDGSSNSVSTTFDALGRVTGVTNPLGAFTYAYVDQTSRLSGVTYPSGAGLSTVYSYFNNTGDQRLQTIQNLSGTTQLSRFDYTYNPVGTIATWTQQADSSTAVVNTLSYDNADQLTSDVQSGGATASNAYGYDPVGNRLSETTGSGTTAGRFNNLNQLTALSGTTTAQTIAGHTTAPIARATVNAVPASLSNATNFTATVPLLNGTNIISVMAYPTNAPGILQQFSNVTSGTLPPVLSYDANGNTTTDENGNTYTWDALNRLTRITYPSTAHSDFSYDGLSRRVQITETDSGGSVTSTKNYLWVGSEIAEERDTSNNVTKRFFPQGEQQIVSGTATPYYYTRDHEGSVRELCNSSGTILTRYTYDVYGKTTASYLSGSVDATFQYAHSYVHKTSGLLLMLFRFYDLTIGRWLNRDPIGEDGGSNLYEYVQNRPDGMIDPLGLDSMTVRPYQAGNPYNLSVEIEVCTKCKNVQFYQRASQDGKPSVTDGTGSGTQPRPPNYPPSAPPRIPVPQRTNGYPKMPSVVSPLGQPSPYYPYANQYSPFGPKTMVDEPGAPDPGPGSGFTLTFDMVTCAICLDGGTPHTIGCVGWGFSTNGYGQKTPYGMGTTNF
jgi:RHS repeat-associated protein